MDVNIFVLLVDQRQSGEECNVFERDIAIVTRQGLIAADRKPESGTICGCRFDPGNRLLGRIPESSRHADVVEQHFFVVAHKTDTSLAHFAF